MNTKETSGYVISKELRDNLLKWDRYEDWMALRTALEVVSLEGVERFSLTSENPGSYSGMRPSDDGSWVRFSDLRRLVAPVKPSDLGVDALALLTISPENRDTGWEKDRLELMKKWDKELFQSKSVQPSAVVSRDICHYSEHEEQNVPYPRKRFRTSCGMDYVLLEAESWDGEKMVNRFPEGNCMKCGLPIQLPQPVAPIQSGGVEQAWWMIELPQPTGSNKFWAGDGTKPDYGWVDDWKLGLKFFDKESAQKYRMGLRFLDSDTIQVVEHSFVGVSGRKNEHQ